LLGLGLALIVGNTIKLLILNRRQEIEITKLVGGTDSFVRRPFLYYGLFFGLFGACLSLFLLWCCAQLMQQPLAQLSQLYDRENLIYSLQLFEITTILFTGGFIGWIAARWSVAHHLRAIQPR